MSIRKSSTNNRAFRSSLHRTPPSEDDDTVVVDPSSYFSSLKKNMTFEEQNRWISQLPKDIIEKKDEHGNNILMYAMQLQLETISFFLISDGYVDFSMKNSKNHTQLMISILYLPSVFDKLYGRIKDDIFIKFNTNTALSVLSPINDDNETVLILALKQYIKISQHLWDFFSKKRSNKLKEKDKNYFNDPTVLIIAQKHKALEHAMNIMLNSYSEIKDLELHHQDNDGNTALILAMQAFDFEIMNISFFDVIHQIIDLQFMFEETVNININAINNKRETAFSTFLQLKLPNYVNSENFSFWNNCIDNIFYKIFRLPDFDPNVTVAKGSYLITALNRPHNAMYINNLISMTDMSTVERQYKNHDVLFYVKNKIASSNKFYKYYYVRFLSYINQKTGVYPISYIDTNMNATNIIDRNEMPINRLLTEHIANIVFKLGNNYFYITYEQLHSSINNVKKYYYECSDNTLPFNLSAIVKSMKYFSIEDIIGQKGYVDLEFLKILYENASIHQTIHQMYSLEKMRYIRDVISYHIVEEIELPGEEGGHFTACNSNRGKVPFYEIVKAYPLSFTGEIPLVTQTNDNNAMNIDDDSTSVKIKLPGDIVKAYKYDNTTTVGDIKQNASVDSNTHIDNIRFMFKGRFLDNDIVIDNIPNFNVADDMFTVFIKKEIILKYTIGSLHSKLSYMYNNATKVSDIKQLIIEHVESKSKKTTGKTLKKNFKIKNIVVSSITYLGNELSDDDVISKILEKDSKELNITLSASRGGGYHHRKYTNKNVFKNRKSNKLNKIRKTRKTHKNRQ